MGAVSRKKFSIHDLLLKEGRVFLENFEMIRDDWLDISHKLFVADLRKAFM